MNNPKLTLYVIPKFGVGNDYFCPFECNFESKDQGEVKGHLVNNHSYEELKKWGYRKDMLQ